VKRIGRLLARIHAVLLLFAGNSLLLRPARANPADGLARRRCEAVAIARSAVRTYYPAGFMSGALLMKVSITYCTQ
jgi:hypothetical protein